MALGLTHDEIAAFIRVNTEKVFSMMLDLPLVASPAVVEGALANGEGGVIALVGFAGESS